ncbi:MAG: phosphodiester glycosidase family protein [Papillibacter sp.]|nr:phosphodiester glycosidase family protein [Papillibacter sp.]
MQENVTAIKRQRIPRVFRVGFGIIWRTLVWIASTAVLLAAALIAVILILNYGPSSSARSIFVSSVLETSAIGFLGEWFLPAEEVKSIQEANIVKESDQITDPGLIFKDKTGEDNENTDNSDAKEESVIEVFDVFGLTYVGKMMVIHDPSLVKVGICRNFGKDGYWGDTLSTIVKRYGAIAAVNGGGFYDPNGAGTGSIPTGITVVDGELIWGEPSERISLIGFNKDNVLIVGEMTIADAMKLELRDAISFGPALIVNGVAADASGGESLNPRTAIGQRADGAILLLCIDGRQPNSLGASYADLIDVFLDYEAVNAANLDGGSSSIMIYNGEQISNRSLLVFDRPLPTSIIVMDPESSLNTSASGGE